MAIAEYDANDTLLRKFICGPRIDEPICLIDVADANARYFYHCDGLGSVAVLSDVNNVLVERYAYDVFGRPSRGQARSTNLEIRNKLEWAKPECPKCRLRRVWDFRHAVICICFAFRIWCFGFQAAPSLGAPRPQAQAQTIRPVDPFAK